MYRPARHSLPQPLQDHHPRLLRQRGLLRAVPSHLSSPASVVWASCCADRPTS